MTKDWGLFVGGNSLVWKTGMWYASDVWHDMRDYGVVVEVSFKLFASPAALKFPAFEEDC